MNRLPSQERADSADEDTGRPELSKPFTNEQDKQIAAFFGHHPCFYDMSHPDYKKKEEEKWLDPAVRPVHVHEW